MEAFYEITDDVKRDVLHATDLVALIGGATTLKKAGNAWKGLCPFHGEKSPSFHVHPAKGFYYCFGCGAKGDAITFVRETERLEFPEAVAYLARLAGITLPMRQRGGTRVDRSKETRVTEALAAAARFFREQLTRHEPGRAFLTKRGVALDEAGTLGFGVAPDAWDALKAGLSDTFTEEVLVEAGLLQKNPDTGRVYDRFRNRLTIEIRDPRGEILGFGARAFGDEQPKYLNSPETPRFSKGKLLFGLDRARDAIRKTGEVILVEGYFDQIAFARAGLENAVASMGTSLTSAQAGLLFRQAETVLVAYDGDRPGRAAAEKAFAILLEQGARLRHLLLPDGDDPDSFLASNGVSALREAVAAAPPFLTSLIATLPDSAADPADRAARVKEIADILRAAADPVLRHELIQAFSRATGVPPRLLSGGAVPRANLDEPSKEPARISETEEVVLSVLLNEWPASAPLVDRIPAEIFSHPAAREVFTALKEYDKGLPTLDFSTLGSHVGVGAEALLARLLVLSPPDDDISTGAGPDFHQGQKGRLEGLRNKLLRLKKRHLEEKSRELQHEMERAQVSGAPITEIMVITEQLSRQKSALASEIQRLNRESKTVTKVRE